MSVQQIEIARILIKETIQQRVQLNKNVINEYAEEIKAEAIFPPLTVFDDEGNFILADGWHRYEAYKLAGIDVVAADIINGGERDAILYAVGANAEHGLQRNNADKRFAVKTMLKDEEWGQWSDGEIARRTRVSQTFVSKVRRELTQHGAEFSSRRICANGRSMNTTNIGQREPGSAEIEQSNVDEASEFESQDTSQDAQGIEGSDAVENEPVVNADIYVPNDEVQNDFERREDDDRRVTSTQTQDESAEETSSEEDENVSPESLHKTIEDNHGKSTFSDVENADQRENSESEASNTVKMDDIAALRSQVFALEQIVREKDEQIRHRDQRIAELEDEVAELKKSNEYNECEDMAT
jgi:hypothetical protein